MSIESLFFDMDNFSFGFMKLLFTVFWQSTIILGACGLICFVLRKQKESLRHILWITALLLLPLLPLISHFLTSVDTPVIEMRVIPSYFTVQQDASTEPGGVIRRETESTLPVRSALNAETEEHPPISSISAILTKTISPWTVLFAGYVLTVCFLVVSIISGHIRVRMLIRHGKPSMDDRILEVFERVKARLSLNSETAIVESDSVRVPLVYGILNHTVIIPEDFAVKLSDMEIEAVAAHELSHIRRHDPLTICLVSLVRCLFFFQPLVWFASREAGYLSECACDRAALEITGQNSSYAALISRFAVILPPRTPYIEYSAGFIFSRKVFLKRIESILHGQRQFLPLSNFRMTVVSILVIAGLTAVFILKPDFTGSSMDKQMYLDELRTKIIAAQGEIFSVKGDFISYLKHPKETGIDQPKFFGVYRFAENTIYYEHYSDDKHRDLTRTGFWRDGVAESVQYRKDSGGLISANGSKVNEPNAATIEIKAFYGEEGAKPAGAKPIVVSDQTRPFYDVYWKVMAQIYFAQYGLFDTEIGNVRYRGRNCYLVEFSGTGDYSYFESWEGFDIRFVTEAFSPETQVKIWIDSESFRPVRMENLYQGEPTEICTIEYRNVRGVDKKRYLIPSKITTERYHLPGELSSRYVVEFKGRWEVNEIYAPETLSFELPPGSSVYDTTN